LKPEPLILPNLPLSLPSPLEEDRLMTLFVDYDGWYEDYQGTQQRLSKEVLRVVQTMKVGQKVLIVEEKEDRNPEDEKEDTVYGDFREPTTYPRSFAAGVFSEILSR
jgi:hypothetical protein